MTKLMTDHSCLSKESFRHSFFFLGCFVSDITLCTLTMSSKLLAPLNWVSENVFDLHINWPGEDLRSLSALPLIFFLFPHLTPIGNMSVRNHVAKFSVFVSITGNLAMCYIY